MIIVLYTATDISNIDLMRDFSENDMKALRDKLLIKENFFLLLQFFSFDDKKLHIILSITNLLFLAKHIITSTI